MTEGSHTEQALSFMCGGTRLWGIVSRVQSETAHSSTGVVIVVGGPQYRVGSHRQFVLLARALAMAGFPTLRFDYRGMGDSDGERRGFEAIEPDLRAATDALYGACPEVRRVVVWGLCDAASAAMMFAPADPRVVGIVAANPWVRSDASLAAATVRHYYGSRLLQSEFWSKLLRGRFDWRASFASVAKNLAGARAHRRAAGESAGAESFQTTMARGLAGFRGQVLLILSGKDLTAQEFVQYTDSDPDWRGLLVDPKVSRIDLPDADHTFSRRRSLSAVEEATLVWLRRHHELAGAHLAEVAGTSLRTPVK